MNEEIGIDDDEQVSLNHHIHPDYNARLRTAFFLCPSGHGLMRVRKANAETIRLVCGCVRPNAPRARHMSFGRVGRV